MFTKTGLCDQVMIKIDVDIRRQRLQKHAVRPLSHGRSQRNQSAGWGNEKDMRWLLVVIRLTSTNPIQQITR